ncbi:DUF6404 family protein [Aeromonas molluscorum]|jgi:hypothetical protein|uniref:Uncharacterized protein n=1 Tax=Aeromonas molluscorum 848 TaxID=1268236 RepID=R1H918_9GAMM|nr:DUF6404 family protein [Aeromonas molluscorum]EOD54924.1 hypothetical protein G113_11766 [Aeromonas molluscorum 848]
MLFEHRLFAAHKELASKGVQELNYNPPLFRLLRRLGLRLKPPHHERFLVNILALGLPTGAIWGVLMWFFGWQHEVSPAFALRQSLLFGIGLGLLMATWLWFRRKQLKLTPWDALPHSTSRTQKRWQPK